MSLIAGNWSGVAKWTSIVPVVGYGAGANSRWGSPFETLAAVANSIRRQQRSNRHRGALPGKTVVLMLRQVESGLSFSASRRYQERLNELFQSGAVFVTSSGYTFEGSAMAPGISANGVAFPVVRAGGVIYDGTLTTDEYSADVYTIEDLRVAYPGNAETTDDGARYYKFRQAGF